MTILCLEFPGELAEKLRDRILKGRRVDWGHDSSPPGFSSQNHIRLLTTACFSGSRRAESSCLHRHLHTCAHTLTGRHTHILTHLRTLSTFMFMAVSLQCLCPMCVQNSRSPGEGIGSSGSGITHGCEPSCRCPESNPGTLKVQPVLLNNGPSL